MSLSNKFAELTDEWVQKVLEDRHEFDVLLRDKRIETRKDAVDFCKQTQGFERKKELVTTKNYNTNDRRFSLSCKDPCCQFRLECQKSAGGFFRVHQPTANLSHNGFNDLGEQTMCGSQYTPSAKELAKNNVFRELKANVTGQPGKKRKFIESALNQCSILGNVFHNI